MILILSFSQGGWEIVRTGCTFSTDTSERVEHLKLDVQCHLMYALKTCQTKPGWLKPTYSFI